MYVYLPFSDRYYISLNKVTQGLQDLNETRVARLNAFWTLAGQLEKSYLTNSVNHTANLLNEIPRNEPRLDSMMFLQHNASQSQEPGNMAFEPSPVWHDDAAIVTDEAAKVFLRNLLGKTKGQIRELRVEADKKKREVESSRKIRENIQRGKDNRSEVDIVRSIFHMQESLHEVERKWLTAEVETSTIISVAGDLSIGAQNHNFRSQTFKIPTNCDLCGERIWGLSAKGFDCRDCGYTCHSKCQMKVPPECPGEQSKEDKKKLKVERQEQASAMPAVGVDSSAASTTAPSLTRQNTMNSLSSGYAASTARSVSNVATQPTPETSADTAPAPAATKPAPAKTHRVLAAPPTSFMSGPPTTDTSAKSKEPRGKMLYPYQATGEDEVTVQDGANVTIVEPDGKPARLLQKSEKPQLIALQMDLDGCVSVPGPERALFQPPTSKPRQLHRQSHQPVPAAPTDQDPSTLPPRSRSLEVPQRPSASGRLWHRGEAPRSCSTSKRCMTTRLEVKWSGRWQRAIGLC